MGYVDKAQIQIHRNKNYVYKILGPYTKYVITALISQVRTAAMLVLLTFKYQDGDISNNMTAYKASGKLSNQWL